MNNGRKISSKYFLALIFTALFFSVTLNSPANYSSRNHFYKTLTAFIDTVPSKKQIDTSSKKIKDTVIKTLKDSLIKDSLPPEDTIPTETDTFHIKMSKDSIEAPIDYTASDSIVLDVKTNKATLYNKATVKQKDLSIAAYKIELDQEKQIVEATYTTDTAGKIIGLPEMKSADNTTTADSIRYNTKSGKGITKNTNTKSGEMFVYSPNMKKVAPEVYYAAGGRFTTCNLDTPHFAFVANKIKLINKKFAITGPVHAEFEGVPIPIYLPFGFFPLAQGRHSGILAPVFTVSDQYGLGLEGLGYYKVVNDNLDFVVKTDLYSYGGYKFYFTPEYYVRYHYRGSASFIYQDTRILSTSGKTEFDDTKTFSLSWTHTVDSKARPGTTFGANVNVASTKYNQLVLNNPGLNYQNNLNSSITYSKTWGDGKYNLTLSGNHNQNNNTKIININLPNIGLNVSTLYPFQKKEFIGNPKWFEKLGVGLTTSVTGISSFYDSLFSFKSLVDTFQWGAHHSIPITLALPTLGIFQIAPGINLQENWYSQKTLHFWVPGGNEGDTLISQRQKGFFVANSASFSLSISTAIFGTFTKFGKNSSILGIRHVIRPTFSISYSPDLNKQYYQNVQVDTGKIPQFQNISVFANSINGGFAAGRFGGISFGIDNNFEMKTKSKKDTSDAGIKKVKLIDGIGFTGSYNYLADSFKLSPIGFYLRSTLFGIINITGSTTLNPYLTTDSGFQRNIYAWDNPNHKFSLGKITNGNLAISASFRSKPKDQKKADDEKKADAENQSQIPMTIEEQQSQLNYIRTHAAEFADFNIAWSVNLSYSLSFTNSIRSDYSGYQTMINSGLNINGDFNLTDKWKVGLTTYYDVKLAAINSLQASISRDLHCWQMSISVTPIGLYRSFNITVSPKSAILRDLRINRVRTFYTQ